MMNTYEVTLTHPRLDGPWVAELVSTSADRAVTRARMTAMHVYRETEFMDVAVTGAAVRDLGPFDPTTTGA